MRDSDALKAARDSLVAEVLAPSQKQIGQSILNKRGISNMYNLEFALALKGSSFFTCRYAHGALFLLAISKQNEEVGRHRCQWNAISGYSS
eukprot:4314787-Amphidinium_carterae.1